MYEALLFKFQFYDSPIKRKRLTVAEIAKKLFQFYDSPIKRAVTALIIKPYLVVSILW